jgi:hypothetical protein
MAAHLHCTLVGICKHRVPVFWRQVTPFFAEGEAGLAMLFGNEWLFTRCKLANILLFEGSENSHS